jgi:hypothetical protein
MTDGNMKSTVRTCILVAAGFLGLVLSSGCTTAPKFRSLTGTDSYYWIVAKDRGYRADSISVQGDWAVVEEYTVYSSKKPAPPASTQTVWIPRDAINRIQIEKGSQ